eukprot:scaffold355580_cov41-Prasinocladus_malaysianus.AAC.1
MCQGEVRHRPGVEEFVQYAQQSCAELHERIGLPAVVTRRRGGSFLGIYGRPGNSSFSAVVRMWLCRI